MVEGNLSLWTFWVRTYHPLAGSSTGSQAPDWLQSHLHPLPSLLLLGVLEESISSVSDLEQFDAVIPICAPPQFTW
jgi:hypothetical protein